MSVNTAYVIARNASPTQTTSQKGNAVSQEKYYSTDLSIPIIEIKAKNKKQAEEFMNQFIDKIAPIMDDQIRWEECDWVIQEHVLDKKQGVWITK
jgi:hypothetical protein